MSAAKHTPGPWMYLGTDAWTTPGGSFVQWGSFNVSANSVDLSDEDYYRIGSVSNVSNSSVNEANARLIAAAPELLEALQAMERKASKQNWNDAYPDELAAARAAIAKATGVPQ